MNNPRLDANDVPARRNFFGRVAGAAALGLAGLVPMLTSNQADAATDDGPNWPGKLKGRHRQLVDAFAINGGYPLGFSYNFVTTNAPGATTAVLILRAGAFPIALSSTMWGKI